MSLAVYMILFMTHYTRTNIPGLTGERDDLFEIAEDSADMLQPFASTCDHYGTLPCIDEEICLHARQPRGVSKIPKCLVKRLVIRWRVLSAFSFITAEAPSESPAAWPRGQPIGFGCLA